LKRGAAMNAPDPATGPARRRRRKLVRAVPNPYDRDTSILLGVLTDKEAQ
jgi:hypothetical protein